MEELIPLSGPSVVVLVVVEALPFSDVPVVEVVVALSDVPELSLSVHSTQLAVVVLVTIVDSVVVLGPSS